MLIYLYIALLDINERIIYSNMFFGGYKWSRKLKQTSERKGYDYRKIKSYVQKYFIAFLVL